MRDRAYTLVQMLKSCLYLHTQIKSTRFTILLVTSQWSVSFYMTQNKHTLSPSHKGPRIPYIPPHIAQSSRSWKEWLLSVGRGIDNDDGTCIRNVGSLRQVIYCVLCWLTFCRLPHPLSHAPCAELWPASVVPQVCLNSVAILTCVVLIPT